MRTSLLPCSVLLLLCLAPAALGEPLVVSEVLLREVPPPPAPRSLAADSLELAIARGEWRAPRAGDAGWRPVAADSTGWIRDEALARGWAHAVVSVPADTTLILEAMGYRGVLVNGEPRVGNIYGYTDDWEPWQPSFDFSYVPVRLRRGENELLFFGSRFGLLRARLFAPEAPLQFNERDTTLPDLVAGEPADAHGALVVMNATAEIVTDARLVVELAGAPAQEVAVPTLPPHGVRKVGFPVRGPAWGRAGDADGVRERPLWIALARGGGEILDTVAIPLAVKEPHENRRVTFVSGIDGSVQHYGHLPAGGGAGSKALVLSLHGAAVEALNQSGSYAPLAWGHVVAPTNRRPFGFNWEDWGRLDALEVLDLACRRLEIDPDRVYLTGHSMGGHGSWHLATLHPDRFAAVGPSAGWISFWSYRPDRDGDADSPLAAMVARATLPSRTLQAAENLAGLGVYVLHGADDRVVSVEEARTMLARLAEFHRDFDSHEQPDAGHWWDASDGPGADCVAWAPMFDFFARHRRPADEEVRRVRFRTPSPGVESRRHWVGVLGQIRPFVMSEVDLRLDPGAARVAGTTANVSRLLLDLGQVAADRVAVAIDGDTLPVARPAHGIVWLGREAPGGRPAVWRACAAPDPALKGPHRGGGFREAFANRVQLVYGTRGTPAENAWARAKARYDAEHLWYQGNASVDVLPDSLYDPGAEIDRNVILYGHAGMHEDWNALWPAGDEAAAGTGETVAIARGRATVGDRELTGGDLALLAVRPRPGSDLAVVGVVGASGVAGGRLLDHRPYLAPGVAYPDLTVLADRGDGTVVTAAGFFGEDWSLARGELVWSEDR